MVVHGSVLRSVNAACFRLPQPKGGLYMWTGPIGEKGTYDHGMTLLFHPFSLLHPVNSHFSFSFSFPFWLACCMKLNSDYPGSSCHQADKNTTDPSNTSPEEKRMVMIRCVHPPWPGHRVGHSYLHRQRRQHCQGCQKGVGSGREYTVGI